MREQIVREPYWLPINSGASNPSLPTRRFFKPRPAVICENLVIRGCNEAVVINDCLEAFADGATMGHEILTVPHFVVKCYTLNWNLSTVGQYKRAARKAIRLAGVGTDAQAAPEQLDVLGQTLAQRPGHDHARHVGDVEATTGSGDGDQASDRAVGLAEFLRHLGAVVFAVLVGVGRHVHAGCQELAGQLVNVGRIHRAADELARVAVLQVLGNHVANHLQGLAAGLLLVPFARALDGHAGHVRLGAREDAVLRQPALLDQRAGRGDVDHRVEILAKALGERGRCEAQADGPALLQPGFVGLVQDVRLIKHVHVGLRPAAPRHGLHAANLDRLAGPVERVTALHDTVLQSIAHEGPAGLVNQTQAVHYEVRSVALVPGQFHHRRGKNRLARARWRHDQDAPLALADVLARSLKGGSLVITQVNQHGRLPRSACARSPARLGPPCRCRFLPPPCRRP